MNKKHFLILQSFFFIKVNNYYCIFIANIILVYKLFIIY